MTIETRSVQQMAAVMLVAAVAGLTQQACAAVGGEVDIIIESRPQGQNYNRYREIEGKWMDSQIPPEHSKSGAPGLTPQASCGSRKFLFYMEEEPNHVPAPAAVRFYPRVPKPGRYYVYATWPPGANATPVTYAVAHGSGQDKITLSQAGRAPGGIVNANRWIPVGSFHFSPGDEHYVEMRVGADVVRVASDHRGQVVADGLRITSKPLPSSMTGSQDAREATPLKWKSSLAQASSEASSSRRKILVFYSLEGSTLSTDVEKKVLGDPQVQAELTRNYVPVKLDFAEHTETAARLGVYRGGTVVVYSSDGSALGQINTTSPEVFLDKLLQLSAKQGH